MLSPHHSAHPQAAPEIHIDDVVAHASCLSGGQGSVTETQKENLW